MGSLKPRTNSFAKPNKLLTEKTALRRGFKAEANAIARKVRQESGLSPEDPLDVWRLAVILEVSLIALSALKSSVPGAVAHFTLVEPGAFSAVTVFDKSTRVIVYNDAHAHARQASDLAHELAHALLHHSPRCALSESGCRVWPEKEECEAEWLSGALLISEEAALAIARLNLDVRSAARKYGVSEAMVRFRLNVTAAHRRAK